MPDENVQQDPATTGTPEAGAPGGEAGVAVDIAAKYERDIAALKSTYDRQLADLKKQLEAKMSDQERAAQKQGDDTQAASELAKAAQLYAVAKNIAEKLGEPVPVIVGELTEAGGDLNTFYLSRMTTKGAPQPVKTIDTPTPPAVAASGGGGSAPGSDPTTALKDRYKSLKEQSRAGNLTARAEAIGVLRQITAQDPGFRG